MHDAISIGIPVLAILFGILLNQRGLERLDGRMDRLESRLDRMQADLSQFYRDLGGLGARIDVLEKKQQ